MSRYKLPYANANSTVFVELMLEVILKTVKKQIIKSNQKIIVLIKKVMIYSCNTVTPTKSNKFKV